MVNLQCYFFNSSFESARVFIICYILYGLIFVEFRGNMCRLSTSVKDNTALEFILLTCNYYYINCYGTLHFSKFK